MINSVEFVLMFLSMFSSVSQENITTVGFIFGLALQYDAMDLWVAMTEHGMYSQVMSIIEPLSGLAECAGYDMKYKHKHKLTVAEAYDMLREIVDPILGRLDLAEMEQIRYTAISGGEVLQLPLDELRALVKNWTRHAREDDEKYGRFGRLPAAGSVGCASESGSIDASGMSPPNDGCGGKRRMPGPDEAVKEGPDNRLKAEKLEAWSKMKMDDRTAAIVMAYCKDYAAPPAETMLGRRGRVKRRELLGWNLAFYETPGRPGRLGGEATAGDEGLGSYGSYSSESSGMCIEFSPSGRTQMVCTKQCNGQGSGRSPDEESENGASIGDGSYREHGTEASSRVGGEGRSKMDTGKNVDTRMVKTPMEHDLRNQVDWSWETDEGSRTRSNTNEECMESNTSQDMTNDSRSLTKSRSMDTIDIRMDCPPLVGYYMRREECLTKNGWPSAPSTPSTSPARSPFPGLTVEQVYDGYANSWDVEQNWLWRRALRDPARQYVGDAVSDLDIEAEAGLEPKRNSFARMVNAVCRKLRGLVKHWENCPHWTG
ncbi:hypothetical protein FRC10_009546 [Ceratobasidium sp. 414]|nr:hypothetical protein FRC10_009546 [Ceratobasidium sp. 414]